MSHDRIIQLVAAMVMVLSTVAAGRILPVIIADSEKHVLRYTNVAVEGAPPWVAIGTAIGALRGLVVDVLWMKVNSMQSDGLYYEVMADAELITKLQPRFSQVWAFLGHNMAYNISVATHTERERWEWVNAGIRLVRNEGIRYNPNDMLLHKELAFWFAHKIEGYADDAHLYYKTEFCKEWHYLLGEPPADYQDRIAWIKEIADAPNTLTEADAQVPGLLDLVQRMDEELSPHATGGKFKLDKRFLQFYEQWKSLKDQFGIAKALGFDQQVLRDTPIFAAFDAIVSNNENQAAGKILIAHLRKRVLIDEYNMDPQLMYEYTRDLGPIDWRHAQAHALYWARRGSEMGKGRVSESDVYHMLNTDRLMIQGMQALAHSGRISFDPFSNELPGRFPEPRWIDTIDKEFERLYIKYNDTRGGGGESFIGFIKNFLSSSVREWYRAGEREKAMKLYNRLDSLFGRGALIPNATYSVPLGEFVRKETRGQYDLQPHLAPSDVSASLRYAFRMGVGQDQKNIWEDALKFANDVTEYFKNNENNAYKNKFDRGRMSELLGFLTDSVPIAFEQVMIDPTIEIRERATIWSKVDEYNQFLRLRVYDQIMPHLKVQFSKNVLAQKFTVNQFFPEPPGLVEYRKQMIAEKARRATELREKGGRDAIETKG